jgi:hypothetical protein
MCKTNFAQPAGLKPVKNTAKMAVPPVKVVRNIAPYRWCYEQPIELPQL